MDTLNLVLGNYASVIATGAAVSGIIQAILIYRVQRSKLEFVMFVCVVFEHEIHKQNQLCWRVTNQSLRGLTVSKLSTVALNQMGETQHFLLNFDDIPKSLEPGQSVGNSFSLTKGYVDSHFLEATAWDSNGKRHELEREDLNELNRKLKEKRLSDTVFPD